MIAPTASTGNKTRLPEMTATTKGRWGNIEVLYPSGLTRRRNEFIPLEMRWNGLGENGMNKLAKWK